MESPYPLFQQAIIPARLDRSINEEWIDNIE